MVKHIVKISIIILWMAALGWHIMDVRSRPLPEKIDAAFLGDYNDYFAIYYGEKKVGWSYKSLRRLPDGSYQAGHATYFEVEFLGDKRSVNIDLLLNLDKSLNIKDFQYVFNAAPLAAVERGAVKNKEIDIEVKLNEKAEELLGFLTQYKDMLGAYAYILEIEKNKTITVENGPLFPSMVPAYLTYTGIEAGRRYKVPIIEPAQRELTGLNVLVESMTMEYDADAGRKVPIYKLSFDQGGAVLSNQWVDRYGRTVREKNAFLSMSRVDDQQQAIEGITPFAPPAMFMNLMKQTNEEELLDFIKKLSGKK